MHFVAWVLFVSSPVLAAAARATEYGIRVPINKRGGLVGDDGYVDISRVNAHIVRTTEKIVRGLETYKVNEGFGHPSLRVDTDAHSRLVKRYLGGVVPLQSFRDNMLWQGSVQVGTPLKNFTVDFDTGSGDFFLPGPDCKTENCQGHNIYNMRQSTTAQVLGTNFTLRYGDGSAVTLFSYNDTVSVAGLTAKNKTFGVATTLNEGFNLNRFPADGIFGMSYRRLSALNAMPLAQQFAKQLHMPAAFAFMLSRGNGTSELTFGATHPSGCKSDITWVNVEEQAYWQISLEGISVNKTKAIGPITSIVDSGTTMILGDATRVADFYAGIPDAKDASNTVGAGLYTIPCSGVPPVEVNFGGREFTISPEDFNLGPVANSTNCLGGIASAPLLKFWVLGDVFMRAGCHFFDFDENRVGISERA